MADLNNLLDEINHRDEHDDDDGNDASSTHHNATAQDPPARSAIPAALEAALHQQQQQRDQSGGTHHDDDINNVDITSHLPDQEYEQLKSLYCQELVAPELLPADIEAVSLHVDLLEGQEETVQHLLQRSSSSPDNNDDGEAAGELAGLMAQITKMDLDRTRYMLVDLARVRMAKMENHALFNWREMRDRLTEEEVSCFKNTCVYECRRRMARSVLLMAMFGVADMSFYLIRKIAKLQNCKTTNTAPTTFQKQTIYTHIHTTQSS